MPSKPRTFAGILRPRRHADRAYNRDRRALANVYGSAVLPARAFCTLLTDIRHRTELIPVREEFFGKKSPASTLVGVAALAQPDWLIEVEAIAVV